MILFDQMIIESIISKEKQRIITGSEKQKEFYENRVRDIEKTFNIKGESIIEVLCLDDLPKPETKITVYTVYDEFANREDDDQ